jgi:hypothetical protein
MFESSQAPHSTVVHKRHSPAAGTTDYVSVTSSTGREACWDGTSSSSQPPSSTVE